MPFDAAEISRAVRQEAARHEQLHERLSRITGPVSGYEDMTLRKLAEAGLKKLGLELPDPTDDPAVVALEHVLRGRITGGMGGSMDAGDTFIDRYLST